ncbi:TonB-dependent receptor [Opitutaceae bacterium TAV4]|nr:TonB-dependent receptor [Opitutaceae bacterium TAV4]RRJ98439.1 TonB-dependent receptor [Opitutaceae bacterium TAV3]
MRFLLLQIFAWIPASCLCLHLCQSSAQAVPSDTAPPPVTLQSLDIHASRAWDLMPQPPTGLFHAEPTSATAYAGAFLEEQDITSLAQLAPYTPGVFIAEKSPANTVFNIRGISSEGGDPRGANRIGIFQDGVPLNRVPAGGVALFDMESVAVLRGPQPTLFARGAEAGAISLVQNKPVDANTGSLTVGAGNYDEFTTTGFANVSLIPGQLFARVAFTRTVRDGYTDNVADDSDLNGRDTAALRGSLRWQPGSRTTLDLIANWQHDTPPATGFKSNSIPPTGGDTSPFTFAELNRGRDLTVDRTLKGITGIITHQPAPDWKITSTTAWREFDSTDNYDADGSRLNLIELTDKSTGRQFSQEFRLRYDDAGVTPFSGSAGLGYFYEEGKQRLTLHSDERAMWPFLSPGLRDQLAALGVPAALLNAALPPTDPTVPVNNLPALLALFNNPALPPELRQLALLAGAPLNPSNPETSITSNTTNAVDLVLDGTWRASDRLRFTAGLRGTFEHITSGYEVENAATPSTLGFILGATPNAIFPPTNGQLEASDSSFSWAGRVAGEYDFTHALTGYASVSRGRRPSGIVLTADAITPFAEEVVWNYEAGFKGALLRNRVLWSASVFYYDYSHFQSMAPAPGNPFLFVVTDAGNATGRGAEFSLQGRITDHLSVFAVYSFTDVTFDATDSDGNPQPNAGYTTRLTPRNTFSLGATWLIPVDGGSAFFVSPVYQYKSSVYFNDNNALFNYSLHQGGFGLMNLRAGWRSPRGRWVVTLYVDNLFDKDYLLDAGNLGAFYDLPTFVAGPPRLYGAQVTVRF